MAENITTTAAKQLEYREKFITAFNDTMVNIWKEQITLLDVLDTHSLLNSVVGIRCAADGTFTNIELSQAFLAYGIFAELGTGRGISRGNGGDLANVGLYENKRKKRPWFSLKYYASVMNLNEFMADNIGKEFLGVVSDALNPEKIAKRVWP